MLVHAAYGVPPRRLVWRYGLRNGLTSVLTLVGMTYGALIENAFLVEVVFSWPGPLRVRRGRGPRQGFQRRGGRDPRGRALVRAGERCWWTSCTAMSIPASATTELPGRPRRRPAAAAGPVGPTAPAQPPVGGGGDDRRPPDRLRARPRALRAVSRGRRSQRPLRPRLAAARPRSLVRDRRGGPRHLQPHRVRSARLTGARRGGARDRAGGRGPPRPRRRVLERPAGRARGSCA